MHEQLLRQEADRQTRALLDRLTVANARQRAPRPLVCLVRPDTPDAGAPEHARLTRMNERVARNLAGFGLHPPVAMCISTMPTSSLSSIACCCSPRARSSWLAAFNCWVRSSTTPSSRSVMACSALES